MSVSKSGGVDPARRPTDPSAETEVAPAAAGARTPHAAPRPVAARGVTVDSTPPATRAEPRSTSRPDYDTFLPVSPDHYVLGREIARGGMGRIRVARDRRLGRAVAVKEVLATAGDAARRFEREARITARLQHPSIVNVHEAGLWPSGEPFYAMKLVAGRRLDVVVAEATTLEQRLALLPSVLAVADAVAYAHGEGVIHRDLKPQNVLVGGFGETVVIDWGLAKDLADSSGEPDGRDGRSAVGTVDAAETAIGDVMGTPAYMPPEQAEGSVVDTRADVYALGAVLDHVLSGRPAYTGANSVGILEAVKRGPPVPLAQRQPGVPPDLLAIVARAMARDAAARYPTALELAEDLRRYQTGQLVGAHHYSPGQLVRRWLRRNRVAVSVAAVAALLVLVLGALALQRVFHAQRVAEEQRARAEEQRARAEVSRADAEDLLGFMLVDLRDKLIPVGRLDLLDDVARKAIHYYGRPGQTLDDTDLAKRALARRNLGAVLAAQGHADLALDEYRAALAISRTLAASDPASSGRQQGLAVSHEKVGDALSAHGDAAAALAAHRTALAIYERLAAADPTSTDLQRELAESETKVGEVLLAQGDVVGALAAARVSSTIAETLESRQPSNALGHRTVAVSQTLMGDVLVARGDGAGALAAYRKSLTLWESLAARDPANADRQRDLAGGHQKVGDMLYVQGDSAGAIAQHRASLAIRERLAAKDPTNTDRQRELSSSYERTGEMLRVQGDAARALAAYRASLAIAETLAAGDPTNAGRQSDLAVSYDKIGNMLHAQGDDAGALAAYLRSLAIAETLQAADPTNADRQRDLSVTQNRVGSLLVEKGDVAGGIAKYRAALAIRESLAAKDPTNADRQADLAISYEKIGDVLLAQRDVAGALAMFRASLAVCTRLLADDPTNTIRQRNVGISRFRIGDALLRQGDATGALENYRVWLATAETLRAKDPTNADREADLAESHQAVGDALAAQGGKATARAEYTAGLAIAQRLLTKDPTNADWRKLVADLAKNVSSMHAPSR